MRRIIVIMVGLAFGLPMLSGQVAPQKPEDAPLQLTVRENWSTTASDGRPSLDMDLQNKGTKSIAAYVLRVDFLNQNGKKTLAAASRVVDASKEFTDYAPGKQWRHLDRIFVARGPDGQLRNFVVNVDYVLFADGSSWGPDEFKLGKKIQAFVQGVRAAIKLQESQERQR